MATRKVQRSQARKTAAMTFRFTPELRIQLRAAAAYEHRSQASLIEVLVREFCAEKGIGRDVQPGGRRYIGRGRTT